MEVKWCVCEWMCDRGVMLIKGHWAAEALLIGFEEIN